MPEAWVKEWIAPGNLKELCKDLALEMEQGIAYNGFYETIKEETE